MLVLPSDHLIRYESLYVDTLRQAIAVAEQGERLVTIGIPPTYPETGYGYIRFANRSESHMPGVYPVEKVCRKAGFGHGKGIFGSSLLPLEQWDVCLEEQHDSAQSGTVLADGLRWLDGDCGSRWNRCLFRYLGTGL